MVISTAGSEKEGREIARRLVDAKLAACVSVIPKVTSFFYWEGRVRREKEVILLMKTVQKLSKKIIKEIKRIHSYKVPEIICFKIDAGDGEYLEWIQRILGGKIKKY